MGNMWEDSVRGERGKRKKRMGQDRKIKIRRDTMWIRQGTFGKRASLERQRSRVRHPSRRGRLETKKKRLGKDEEGKRQRQRKTTRK